MSNTPLKKLSIEYLRGSVQPFTLAFQSEKKLTIVYGENGTGKSTICDALDLIGNGTVGSLDKRGLGKTNRYWHSVGKTPKDVAVTLETSSASCRATLIKSNVVVLPSDHQPRVEVWRRAQLLSLIEAKPGERYEAISRFIEVTEIESAEDSLREAIKEIKERLEIAVAIVQENRGTIEQFWQEAGKPGTDYLKWALQESRRDVTALEAEAQALANLSRTYETLAGYPAKFTAAEQKTQESKSALQTAQASLDQSISQVTQDASSLVGILEAAQKHFAGHPTPSVCPLCESAEKVEGLAARVNTKLDALTALRTAQATKRAKEQALEQAIQQSQTLLQIARDNVAEFEKSKLDIKLPAGTPLPTITLPTKASDWATWLKTHTPLVTQWKQAASERLGKTQYLGTLRRALETLNENTRAEQELDTLLPKLNQTLEIVQIERRKFTDSTLKDIAVKVGKLYEQVHPGEGLDKISLALDPDKRASLDLGATFDSEKDAPPQAYFSESHLDTLGLCVFLALAGMDSPDETILVLDDILASVDEPHVERLIEMLYAETTKFRHCVITTHYRPWKEKLRWGWLQNGQCHFVELTKWSKAEGMSLVKSIPDIDRLRQLLAETPPDLQLVCGKAGVILEAMLDFLTLHYECNVPRKAGGYTLGELLPAIDKKLRPALRVEVLEIDSNGNPIYRSVALKPYFDELERIMQARNVFGAHFNQMSFELLDADAIGFGHQVLELASVLVDSNAGWPKNDKSGNYWATSGETRRLYPHGKPK